MVQPKKKKRKIEREFARGTKTEFARGRTILVQPKKKKKFGIVRGSSLAVCLPKFDLPPPSDSCDPMVKFFFSLLKFMDLVIYLYLVGLISI